MIDNIFPKYRLQAVGNEWGITKRHLIFWSKLLTHLKFVLCDDIMLGQAGGSPSHEYLTFKTHKAAQIELNRLNMGSPQIISRVYHKGKMTEENHAR